MFLSGIGCAARLPYYMNTYGMHSIHGRALGHRHRPGRGLPRSSTSGSWVVTATCCSIGGNHLIHALRRNVNLTILLFNNQIYGLTKGQYSPTSELGKVTKSTPFGSLDQPFNPVSLALGAEATFVARTHDLDRCPHARHVPSGPRAPGRGLRVEIYQNCNVFNDGAFVNITAKDRRDDMLIPLVHGQPIRFGAERERGVVMGSDGMPRIVTVADVGEDALLVHDETNQGLAFQLCAASPERSPRAHADRASSGPSIDA